MMPARLFFSAYIVTSVFFSGCGDFSQVAASRAVEARTFEVVKVIDGDTFKIFYDGELVRVRLPGIDAAERGKPGADEATAVLREMIDGKVVRIEFTADRKRDMYGRLLATAWVVYKGHEVNVEAELLARGLVRPWVKR